MSRDHVDQWSSVATPNRSSQKNNNIFHALCIFKCSLRSPALNLHFYCILKIYKLLLHVGIWSCNICWGIWSNQRASVAAVIHSSYCKHVPSNSWLKTKMNCRIQLLLAWLKLKPAAMPNLCVLDFTPLQIVQCLSSVTSYILHIIQLWASFHCREFYCALMTMHFVFCQLLYKCMSVSEQVNVPLARCDGNLHEALR